MIGAVRNPVLAPLYRLDSLWRLTSHFPFEELSFTSTEALIHQVPTTATTTGGDTLVEGFMGRAWTATGLESRVYHSLLSASSYSQFTMSLWCYVDKAITHTTTPRLASIRTSTKIILEIVIHYSLDSWIVRADSVLFAQTHSGPGIGVGEWSHVVASLSLINNKMQLWVNGVTTQEASFTTNVFPPIDMSHQFFSLGNSIEDSRSFTGNHDSENGCFPLIFSLLDVRLDEVKAFEAYLMDDDVHMLYDAYLDATSMNVSSATTVQPSPTPKPARHQVTLSSMSTSVNLTAAEPTTSGEVMTQPSSQATTLLQSKTIASSPPSSPSSSLQSTATMSEQHTTDMAKAPVSSTATADGLIITIIIVCGAVFCLLLLIALGVLVFLRSKNTSDESTEMQPTSAVPPVSNRTSEYVNSFFNQDNCFLFNPVSSCV